MKQVCPVCDTPNPNFLSLPFEYFQQLNQVQATYSLEDFETLNLNHYLCPVCQSTDRERLYALYFKKIVKKRSEGKPLKVLDVAPSMGLSRFIKKHNVAYRSADLLSPLADDRIDITDMSRYLDESFDFLICSHVLEHIPDDIAALRELFRVLSPGGEAIIMVPILMTASVTDEDPNETCEIERWRRFGQNDHVRMYCKQDFIHRLEEGGFEVFQLGVEFFGKDAFYKHGISLKSVLYIGRKPYQNYDANHIAMNQSNNFNALYLENKKLKEELSVKNALLAFQEDFFYELRDIRKKRLYFRDIERLSSVRKSRKYDKSFQEIEPLVSVIIPTFNRAKIIIERTIPSVLNQDYKNWELIIIGDAMNEENCQTIINGINDKRIFFYNLKKRGRYPGRFGPLWYSAGTKPVNFGLRIARGSWICHLDDDDEFLSDHISSLLSLAKKTGSEWVHGKVLFKPDAGDTRNPVVIGNEKPSFECISRISSIYHAALKTFRYNTNSWQYKYPGDWDLWERFLDMGVTHIHLPKIVSIHHGNMSPWYDKYAKLVIGKLNTDNTVDANYVTNQENTYNVWRNRHRWSTSAVTRLAEKVAPLLESGAGVHLLMVAAADDNNAIADTIDTLATQGSAGWWLTVFSPDACPNPLFEKEPKLAWVQITAAEELPSALNQAAALSPVHWFMVCSPGIRFEPPFVSLVLATSAQHPDWRCIYIDEERINSDGQMTDPRLKPDANLELLHSSAYVGQAVLTHRALWPVLNLYLAAMPRAFAFDAALRAVESGGESALGHIDELVVALPETAEGASEDWALIAKPLLEGHLQRSGLIANVNDGYLPTTFFVDYALTIHPLVSIIIPTKDRLDLLQPCIASLLEKTSYSNYEVIIVDNNSTDPPTLAYLEQLTAHDERIKVLRYAQHYNYSAINNFAAQQAKGEFLVLLNNDTVVVQEIWLERMMSIGLRQEVGAVGCRLVYADQRVQHAGVIIGLSGIAEHIGIGSLINDSGYMGRAQQTQNFSAVTAACMLVRKDLFLEVGGLDENDFSILYNDIDFCLKISERNYRIVWTPFVTLIHHGNSSLKQEHDANREKQNLRSRKAFINKWRHRLGNDPAYNRHLSLRQREWMIDGDFDVPWHPDLEPLPRIVAQPPDEMGVGQYRMIGPLKELTDSGRICSFLLPALTSDKRFLPYVSELIRAKPTVFFLQNAFSDFHLDDLQHYAELLPDLFRVFGQDDIVFSIPQKSAARKHFGRDTKARVRKAASLCHRAIVTTEPIAEAMRGMVDDIQVMPNTLERSRWGGLQPPRNERRKPRVGWAGAQQHQGDLEFILPVVEATANEVDWIFMGMCPPKLRYHVAEAHNAVPFAEYPAALAALDLDLAIAPLELNRFNTAKSNLRLLEYGAVGYPVIATDILPYRNAPVTRVPNNPKAWIDAIRAHVRDPDATRAAGDQLREWVLSHWMLDQHLDEWLKALLPD